MDTNRVQPEKSSTRIQNDLAIRDIIYWKDLQLLHPKIISVNEVSKPAEERTLKRFLQMWVCEVLCGIKQMLYEGSLHGVKYIFEPTFNRKEKFTWIIIMSISVSVCVANIAQLFKQWNQSPFVNVMDSLQTPVWAVPFPSVALCPHLHVKRSYANVSNMNFMDQFFSSLVCPRMMKARKLKNKQLSAEQNRKLEQFILEASPKCSEVIRGCYWRAIDDQEWLSKECCDILFRPVFTNYGRCYAFNRLPLNGMTNTTTYWQRIFDTKINSRHLLWNLDDGYPKVFPPDPTMKPFRTMASGEMYGLGIELHLNISEHQYACDEKSLGYTLLIGSPTDHLYTSTVLRLPLGRTTAVEVSPITYRTDPSLRSLPPGRRQCFFQNERQLEYYSVYTDSNCKHDLLIRESKRTCNCVQFNWPRKHHLDPICSTVQDYQCLFEVNAKVEEQLIYAYFADSEENTHSKVEETSCYPSCNDLLYNTQVYYSDLKVEFDKNDGDGTEINEYETTRINVHFYDDMFIGLHRHAQYDYHYFAGAVGGLLSLFLGFSIISVAEFVYFVILRPIRRVLYEAYCKKR